MIEHDRLFLCFQDENPQELWMIGDNDLEEIRRVTIISIMMLLRFPQGVELCFLFYDIYDTLEPRELRLPS